MLMYPTPLITYYHPQAYFSFRPNPFLYGPWVNYAPLNHTTSTSTIFLYV
ncbi:hypothetical protein GCM10009865_41970 [Aeromicrobium ponti]|uniref:Uncharacterized protein n=1 Tax=Cytobacillus oceanisediminis TaxID=665099 RepID=A0A562JIR5_9BACI|nr:hypothetical protein IQ19_04023 [Cytobacillus oceanisediminis]